MSFTRWTPEMVAELRAHVAENKLFMKEIAERMGLKPTSKSAAAAAGSSSCTASRPKACSAS